MTVDELITEARDHHESFTPVVHLERVCRQELRRAELRFFHYVANVAPGSVALDTVFSKANITTALTGTPLVMPAYVKMLQVVVAVGAALYRVSIHQDELSAGSGAYIARLIGRNLYLIQPTAFMAEMDADLSTGLKADSQYVDADALRVTYVAEPPALTTTTQTMTAPDESRMYFVGSLVEFMARRSSRGMGPERQELLAGAQVDKALVLDAYTSRSANESTWYVAASSGG